LIGPETSADRSTAIPIFWTAILLYSIILQKTIVFYHIFWSLLLESLICPSAYSRTRPSEFDHLQQNQQISYFPEKSHFYAKKARCKTRCSAPGSCHRRKYRASVRIGERPPSSSLFISRSRNTIIRSAVSNPLGSSPLKKSRMLLWVGGHGGGGAGFGGSGGQGGSGSGLGFGGGGGLRWSF
jgi:uncharacterized membrane protein YgcG